MPFLELSITVDPRQQANAEQELTELGALSITLRDANAETADEQAIFEPGVGELPMWQTSTLSALFPAETNRESLATALARTLPWLDVRQVHFDDIADQDWERAWMDQFQPMRFGRRLWIYPWNIEPPAAADPDGRDDAQGGCLAPPPVVVRLDPGLAFGSGTHPTTALCLEWLDGLALAGNSIIDYGCGSGILAIAALKLGAAHATGIDNDPQALLASADNAQRNDVARRLTLRLAQEGASYEPADVLVANILAAPLAMLAQNFADATRPGAALAISGILQGQETELLQRYGTWFEALQVTTLDGWVRISGRRRS